MAQDNDYLKLKGLHKTGVWVTITDIQKAGFDFEDDIEEQKSLILDELRNAMVDGAQKQGHDDRVIEVMNVVIDVSDFSAFKFDF